jgi:hypothetical protein
LGYKNICFLFKVSRSFGGTYRLHLQSRNINQAVCYLLFTISLPSFLFFHEDEGKAAGSKGITQRYVPEPNGCRMGSISDLQSDCQLVRKDFRPMEFIEEI